MAEGVACLASHRLPTPFNTINCCAGGGSKSKQQGKPPHCACAFDLCAQGALERLFGSGQHSFHSHCCCWPCLQHCTCLNNDCGFVPRLGQKLPSCPVSHFVLQLVVQSTHVAISIAAAYSVAPAPGHAKPRAHSTRHSAQIAPAHIISCTHDPQTPPARHSVGCGRSFCGLHTRVQRAERRHAKALMPQTHPVRSPAARWAHWHAHAEGGHPGSTGGSRPQTPPSCRLAAH